MPTSSRAPLAQPGEVIKLSRGAAAAHIATLSKQDRQAKQPGQGKGRGGLAISPPKAKRSRPRPSREKVEQPRAALDEAKARHAEEGQRLRAQEEALARKRQWLEAEQAWK